MRCRNVAVWVFLFVFALAFAAVAAVGDRDFAVKSFSPEGLVSGRAEVVAVFTKPVVAADRVGAELSASELPFVFSPPVAGNGKWRDERTFVFYPKAGLLSPATSYTASVRAGLSDVDMKLFTGRQSFEFHTAPLAFAGARQVNFDAEAQEVVFELEFSLPVSPSRLRGYIDVKDNGGRALDYKVVQSPVSRKVRVSVRAGETDSVRLKLERGLPSESGPLGLEKSVSLKLAKSSAMSVLDSNALSNIGNGEIYIETAAPVDFARAAAFIEVSPKLAYSVEPRERGLAITGNFAPQDRVTVTLRRGFPAISGKALAAAWSRSFIFPEKNAAVKLAAPGRVLTPESGLLLPVETVNLDRLHVIVWKLYENNIPIGMRSSWAEYPLDLSAIRADKNYKVRSVRNKAVRSALDLKPLIGSDKGVFLVVAQSDGEGNEWAEDRQVINVTDLGVTVKSGQGSAVVRVNSIHDGRPVSGASVTFWSWANQPVAEGKSDKEGVAEVSLDSDENPVLVTVKNGSDVAFIRLDNGLFGGRSEIDTEGEAWVSRGYSAFCYMPRDIFRPGEKIPFRAVLRDVKGKAPKPFPAFLTVYTSTGRIHQKQAVKLSPEGVLNAVISIPQDAPTGAWTASVTSSAGDLNQAGFKEFYVEEFAAPRLFVETTAVQKQIIGEDELDYSIFAKYAFGSPAPNLPREVSLTVSEKEFAHKDWKGFSFTDVEAEFQPVSFFADDGKLDKNGRSEGAVLVRSLSAPSMAEISLRGGVMEEGGRWVYKTAVIPWYPRKVMLGISMPQEAEPGAKTNFTVGLAGVDGKPAAAKSVKFSFFRVVERAVKYETGDGSKSRVQEELLPKEKGTLSLTGGRASGVFTPSEGGKYLLRAEDTATGAKASKWIYVYGGSGETGSVLPDTIKITTDKKIYRVGESAKVKVSAPFSGSLMLNIETYKVVSRKVVQMKGKETELSVKITEDMLPNGWITAHAVRGQKDGGSSRAYGAALLAVDNRDSKLNVEIRDFGRIMPGKNDFSLTVKNSKGSGAAANITVMLTDEAILGLTDYETPDPWKFFTAKKRLGVETYDLYNALIAPESKKTPLLIAGGGAPDSMAMKNSSLNPVQAKRFKMLSLAKTVRSDASGKCDFSFVVPEFAGRARLIAVAVTEDKSGSASRPVDINRDIVTEPSLPRILAPNDEISVPCQIFNKKSKADSVSLKIETKGPLKLIGKSEYRADIAPGKSVSFPLAFKAEGAGKADVAYITSWSSGTQKSNIEIAVRPAAPRASKSGYYVVKPGEKLAMNIPSGWYSGTFGGTVLLSAMPSVGMSELASYLITYPHGCLEQTTSSAWPLLVGQDIARAADPALANDKAVRASLMKRLEKIYALQNYDGGFVSWQGESWSEPFDSIYAAHLLTEAQRAGIRVPEETMKQAMTYVRRLLSVSPENPNNEEQWRETLTRRAYACYVLALAKDAPLGWMESIRDKSGSLDSSGRLYLASAYAAAGQKKEASAILGKKLEILKKVPGGTNNYDSDIRNAGLALLAYCHIDPKGADAVSAAVSLTEKLKHVKYYNTQEAGISMLALSKYFRAAQMPAEPKGTLTADGKNIGAVDAKNPKAAPYIKKAGTVTAENSGKSQLFAAWSVSGVPAVPVKNSDSGVEVRVSLSDRNGRAAGAKIKRGTALTASITVKPKAGALKEVVVVMPLAAGLEIEKASYTAQNRGNDEDMAESANIRAEARDDRLILYINRLEKPIVWRASLRAVTEGKFTVPQTSAECMYDPAVSSLTGGGKMEITREK